MKPYQPNTPRAALGMAAVAMAAITMALLVELPAKFEYANAGSNALAAQSIAARAPIEVAIIPPRIDVTLDSHREAHLHTSAARLVDPRKPSATIAN